MPEKTIKRRLTEAGALELADGDGPIFSTVVKLVDALQRAVPQSRDLELKKKPRASFLNCAAGRSTKKSDKESTFNARPSYLSEVTNQ